jgi:acid phosphatase type 7
VEKQAAIMPGGRQFGRPRLRAADPPLSASLGAQFFQPLPPPTGVYPFRMTLASVIGDPAVAAITESGTLDFHVMGDTGGINAPLPQENVAQALEMDLPSVSAPGVFDPSFLYLLGDCVYFSGAEACYYDQFYGPYTNYLPPIVAIPGNHDGGGVPLPPGQTPLDGFLANFCTSTPILNPQSQSSGRHTMTQPNVYWTLEAPFATVIGLYTNVSETDGQLDDTQIAWLNEELAAAPEGQAVIVAMHHPPISADDHYGSSNSMFAILDAAIAQTGRAPTMVLAGHVHNYQRFTRTLPVAGADVTIPYIVLGNGGYHNLHSVASDAAAATLPFPMPNYTGVTLDHFDDNHYGYARIIVTAATVVLEYVAVSEEPGVASAAIQPQVQDRVLVGLGSGSIVHDGQ